jgi:hypothetical protein
MKKTAVSKLALASSVTALMVVFGSATGAVAGSSEYTYSFDASNGYSGTLNGSTVTIDATGSGGIVSFDILDGANSYTTGTLTGVDITGFGSSGWTGSFYVDNLGGISGLTAEAWGYTDEPAGSLDVYTVDFNSTDPPGNWEAPDEASTLALLLGVVMALAGASGYLRRRCAVARR